MEVLYHIAGVIIGIAMYVAIRVMLLVWLRIVWGENE